MKVHDIVYKKQAADWSLFKSFYRKLRLSKEWTLSELSRSGFNSIDSEVENGVITIIATK